MKNAKGAAVAPRSAAQSPATQSPTSQGAAAPNAEVAPGDCSELTMQPAWHDARWRAQVRRRLLAWFAKDARQLPWRTWATPYHVWVSEIMLQQTQVATVIDYYQRFIAAYPTIADLAAADEQQLMRLWEGLGYYRRARSMQAAAKVIVQHHGGVFPDTYEQVIALPGIGRYTAGAILSIAAGGRLPVLEGNTVRVYSRWAALQRDVSTPAAKATLWEMAEAMLPRKGAGQFNQAAMELGALICRPKGPRCQECCVRSSCKAYALGLQDTIPGKVKQMQYEPRKEFAFVVPIAGRGAVLLCRVPATQRWAGLWDFPRWTHGDAQTPHEAADALSRLLQIEIRPAALLTTIKHAVTRYRITLQVWRAAPIAASTIAGASDNFRAIPRGEFADLPLSVTGRKIAALVESGAIA
jgi:A/G-specific adenine glycosylase